MMHKYVYNRATGEFHLHDFPGTKDYGQKTLIMSNDSAVYLYDDSSHPKAIQAFDEFYATLEFHDYLVKKEIRKMIDKAILIYTESSRVEYNAVNAPSKLFEALQKNSTVITNNVLVIACFRSLVHEGIVKEGVISCYGKGYRLDKYGRYESEVPPYEDLYDTYLLSLL